jgi:hypothetical protein
LAPKELIPSVKPSSELFRLSDTLQNVAKSSGVRLWLTETPF